VRHCTAWDADPQLCYTQLRTFPGMLGDERFRAGFAQLARFDLGFDAWVYHTQLRELTALAHEFPGTRIVLDHAGSPLRIGRYANCHREVLSEWRAGMRELARCPNVTVKLGGVARDACASGAQTFGEGPMSQRIAAAIGDDFHYVIDAFTPQRCMFESNFPVDKSAVTYSALWNSYKRIAARFSDDERASLFHDTAARVYSIRSDAVMSGAIAHRGQSPSTSARRD
jgi:L-fuconolactonase